MPTFPDPPGTRFMYDADGTLFLTTPDNATTPLTSENALLANDEDQTDVLNGGFYNTTGRYREYLWVFPELRDLTGIYLHGGTGAWASINMSYSADTTDGSDGTWTSYGSVLGGFTTSANPLNTFRSAIMAIAGVSNIKGIKIRFTASNSNGQISGIHLYGNISPAQNIERVEFWEPVTNAILNKMGLDFGDIPQGATVVKQFRIKNLSTTKTATNTVLTRENNSGGSQNDALVTGLQFSLDGTTYATTVTVPSIAPGAISAVLYARRVVGPAEVSAARVARVKAIPTTFAV